MMQMVGIRHAAAAAVELCEAVPAFRPCIDTTFPEFIRDLRMGNSFIYIAHAEFIFSNELMARIQITPWRNSQILCSAAAAGKPFGYARATVQIDHKMKEIKASSFPFPPDHLGRKPVILLENRGNILFPDRIRLLRIRYNRLD